MEKISIPIDRLGEAYEKMITIRKAEEAFEKVYMDGKIPGFLHLYLGEEAIASGVCMNLKRSDYVTSTHRGHGHFIAKGSDIKKIAAEIMGKETGLCKGRGGSMHMIDVENGLYGSTGIVGGGFPPAVGLGLAAKYKKTGQVSVCFFGDGAVNEGTFHEAINLAAIWSLPIIFICENNMYAQSAPQEYHQKVKDISKRAEGYGIEGETVDGMDIFQIYKASRDAVERARKGFGPTLLECKTYLFTGHYVGDPRNYRYKKEMEYYKNERDCIKIFEEKVLNEKLITKDELMEIERKVERTVDEAIRFAEESSTPDRSEVMKDVY